MNREIILTKKSTFKLYYYYYPHVHCATHMVHIYLYPFLNTALYRSNFQQLDEYKALKSEILTVVTHKTNVYTKFCFEEKTGNF